MTTEQEVLDDLIQAITNTNTSNDDFLKVLKEGRDQDVALRDGTVVPSLTKRVVNAFSNSDYLMKADNLASVVDKQEARDNLNVPTKEDVLTATAQATETEKGTAKIATTAIAQAGTNDTDIITAKKLRNALNASGNAPISACRAWVCFNGKQSPPVILSSLNISSVVKNATGDYTLNFATPLENSNYSVSCGGATGGSEYKVYPCVKATVSEGVPVLKTPNQLRVACVISTQGAQLYDMSEIYIEVFN